MRTFLWESIWDRWHHFLLYYEIGTSWLIQLSDLYIIYFSANLQIDSLLCHNKAEPWISFVTIKFLFCLTHVVYKSHCHKSRFVVNLCVLFLIFPLSLLPKSNLVYYASEDSTHNKLQSQLKYFRECIYRHFCRIDYYIYIS